MPQWTLTDNSTGSPVVFTFDINPREYTPPGRKGRFQTQTTVASGGQAVLFQGRDEVPSGSFTGAVRTQSFYNGIDAEAAKWYPLVLTDDQGTTWDIIITNINWTRLKRATNQWRYDYTIEFIEV